MNSLCGDNQPLSAQGLLTDYFGRIGEFAGHGTEVQPKTTVPVPVKRLQKQWEGMRGG